MKDRFVIDVHVAGGTLTEELEVPADISVIDLIEGLSSIYGMEIDHNKLYKYYLKMDYPKALLRGEILLRDTGMRDGSEVWFWNEE